MRGSNLRHAVMPSPNIDQRRNGQAPKILLLHYTGMAEADMALKRLCDPAAQVSCHYLVHDDGRIVQMVDEDLRAWHAGVSSWHGVEDVNSQSIGIEIHNIGHNGDYPDFTVTQMGAVVALCRDILLRHDISPHMVLGHSDVAPGRKADPGEKFSWHQLWLQGIGHWVLPAPLQTDRGLALGDEGAAVMALQARLARYGYGVSAHGKFEEQTRIVVEAFQRHFRPARVNGIADASTCETLDRLLATASLPVGGTV